MAFHFNRTFSTGWGKPLPHCIDFALKCLVMLYLTQNDEHVELNLENFYYNVVDSLQLAQLTNTPLCPLDLMRPGH